MLNAQLVLFVYIAVGFYLGKKQIFDEQTKKKLTSYILKIALPCMIFNSFNDELTVETLKKTGMAFLVALIIALVSFILGKFIYNRFPKEQKGILQYCTMVNNSGFLGLPLVEAVYGDLGLMYASIAILPNRIMMWTAGISVFTSENSGLKTQLKNVLLNPGIVAVYLGVARRLLNVPLPAFLDTAIGKIGATTSPLSMMIIGTMLVGVNLRQLFNGAALYQSFVRLIALPLLALLCMRLLHFDPTLTGTTLILTGMPAGSTSVLLATQYGGDEVFASKLVVSSTLLSLITAPLLMLLL